MATASFIKSLEEFSKVDKNHSKNVHNYLTYIRKNIEWPRDKRNILELQGHNSLGNLVVCLDTCKQSVLGITLSILGNCCMLSSFSHKLIFKYNIFVRITNLLKVPIEEDSTNGRIFRLIGNLCQHRERWGNIIINETPKILIYMIEFLKKYTDDENTFEVSDATIRLNVRALRYLLNSQTIIQMINHGVPKVVGALLIKCSTEWEFQKSKDKKEVLSCIIKLLLQFSKYRHRPLIEELKNTKRGNSIVYLSQILLISPKKIVKLIMNLINVSNLKSDLPIPDICDGFTGALENFAVLKECRGQYMEYIECLCFLLEHPANRNSSRCKNAIPQLVKVLDKFDENTEDMLESCLIIVKTLGKCAYHPSLINEQLQNNAIEILMKKLERIIDPYIEQIENHSAERRRRKRDICPLELKINNSLNIPISPNNDLSRIQFPSCPSPSSESDSEFSCRWSSPRSSPLPKNFDDFSNYDSDNYSPLCSDEDNDHVDDTNSRASEHSDDNSDLDYESHGPFDGSSSLTFKLVRQIVGLLKEYSIAEATQIYSEKMFRMLFKCSIYLQEMENSNSCTNLANTLLCRLLKQTEFFSLLLQSDIFQLLDKFYWRRHQICNKCDSIKLAVLSIISEISNLATHNTNVEIIINYLTKGSIESKKNVALNISFVICDLKLLRRLMIYCGGLKVLLNLLKEAHYQKTAIQGVCLLAKKLLTNIKSQQKATKLAFDEYQVNKYSTNLVTFKLDDESTVKVDRTLICAKSEFFDSLLNGSFKEAKQDVVELHETNAKTFKCMLNMLCYDIEKCGTKDLQCELETLLDVINLSDRYLLKELSQYVSVCVLDNAMNRSTAPVIYKWAIDSNTEILRTESLSFSLTNTRKVSDKVLLINRLLEVTACDQLICDLEQIFNDCLKKI